MEIVKALDLKSEVDKHKEDIYKGAIANGYMVDNEGGRPSHFALLAYLLFTLVVDDTKFYNLGKEDIFYNRFYWFSEYVRLEEQNNGYDPGLNQQAVKLLEEAEHGSLSIDWDKIQEISDMVGQGGK